MKPDRKLWFHLACIMTAVMSWSILAIAQTGPFYIDATNGNDSWDCTSATHTSGTTGPCLTFGRVEQPGIAGTNAIINIAAGTYRLSTGLNSTSGWISAKDGQTFVGTPSCCTAVISGGIQLCAGSYTCSGPDSKGNYSVSNMTQAGQTYFNTKCDPGWPGCFYPEDLYLNGVPLQHLSSVANITSFTGTSGTLTFSASNNLWSTAQVQLEGFDPTGPNNGLNGQIVTVLSSGLSGAQFEAAVTGSSYSSSSCPTTQPCGTATIQTPPGETFPFQTHLTASTWWFDYTGQTIWFHFNPTGKTVETSVLATMFNPSPSNGPQANGITINRLMIQEFASPLGQAGAVDPNYLLNPTNSTGTGWTVENSYINLNHGKGVRPGFGTSTQNSVVMSNVITKNGNMGVGAGLPATTSINPSYLVVQKNTITSNNYAHVAPGFGAGGIKVGNTANVVIRQNTVNANMGDGIHFDVNSINPLIDGNTVTNNVDTVSNGGGIELEISNVQPLSPNNSTVRNNIVQYNGTGAVVGPNYQIESADSSGMQAYCNLMEVGNSNFEQVWSVHASDRGNNTEDPNSGNYITSVGNFVHHNTIIFDSGALGLAGYSNNDTTNQPNFFADNTAPDYDTYHVPSAGLGTGVKAFYYSAAGTPESFANFQSAGADVNGGIDTTNTSGFPTVKITNPLDGATVTSPVTIHSTASDSINGIKEVDFYQADSVPWTLLGTVTSTPYNYTWTSPPTGTHIVAAMAISNISGIKLQNCWAITITVN